MKILFITNKQLYLYDRLYKKLARDLFDKDISTGVLIRENSKIQSNYNLNHFSKQFNNHYFVGSEYFKLNQGMSIRLGLSYYFNIIKSLKCLGNDVSKAILNYKPDLVITSDSADICISFILRDFPDIPIYFLQVANYVNSGPKMIWRKRIWNRLNILFAKVGTYRDQLNPPFSSKKIHYILWSKIFSKNIDSDYYKISYIPKIVLENQKIGKISKNHYSKILVILNKRSNIGLKSWEKFANIYKNTFKNFDGKVIYKIHPSEDIDSCKKYFKESQIIKGDVSLDDINMVISHWSSYIYDAALFGKAIILVNPNREFNFRKYNLNDFPIFAHNKDELLIEINNILKEKYDIQKINQAFLDKHLGSGFGPSTSNLISFLEKKNASN